MLIPKPKIKLLTFTSLYPNAEHPRHGIFVENRLRHLVNSGQVESLVVAPIPWFPFSGVMFGNYGRYAKIPKQESRHGIDVLHPRYPAIPKIGMTIAPSLMASFLLPVLKKIEKKYAFDIIDAHYFYPDGVAAAILGKILKKPVVITGRGTDLNCISQYYLPKKMIKWAATTSYHNIVVSNSLKEILLNMNIDQKNISVLANGVDNKVFNKYYNKRNIKNKLNLDRFTILCVGNLVKNKGHDIVIKAVSRLKFLQLIIIGEGCEENSLKYLARKNSSENRIRFIKNLNQNDLAEYYKAADVFVLASEHEGCPNVVLESLSCGTPVVATKVGNIAELVKTEKNIFLFERNNIDDLVNVLSRLQCNGNIIYDNELDSNKYSWGTTVKSQIHIYSKAVFKTRYPH